jgi:hypothetical protein
MSASDTIQGWREWFPVPTAGGRPWIVRWVLLEANRNAVAGALLTGVFAALVAMGTIWTFEMQRLLTETPAVQTILNTLLSGIILLVSIVISINSIVLSYDITSIETQEERIEGIMEYRQQIGEMTDREVSPTDPASFLEVMGEVIHDRAEALKEVSDGTDEEVAEEIEEYIGEVTGTVERLGGSFESATGAEFGVLWLGLDVDYGDHLDRSRALKTSYGTDMSESFGDRLDELVQAFELFAIGKEYFKTLYYSNEVAQLSRTLLVVSLPAILFNAGAILAINAELFPQMGIPGISPLLLFVAITFTISLAPYLILTSYMLRLATVARRTASAGPFSLT